MGDKRINEIQQPQLSMNASTHSSYPDQRLLDQMKTQSELLHAQQRGSGMSEEAQEPTEKSSTTDPARHGSSNVPTAFTVGDPNFAAECWPNIANDNNSATMPSEGEHIPDNLAFQSVETLHARLYHRYAAGDLSATSAFETIAIPTPKAPLLLLLDDSRRLLRADRELDALRMLLKVVAKLAERTQCKMDIAGRWADLTTEFSEDEEETTEADSVVRNVSEDTPRAFGNECR